MKTNICSTSYLMLVLLLQASLFLVEAWDADELSLFDVIEEVNENFYELFGVDQSASSADIRRAYRKLSLQLHPDKNKEADAETRFRRLVAAYEVLKDDAMRVKYNEILVNGLPDWRQPVFYYRRVRKMGLLEMSILLTIILTVGHFLVIWSVYLERRFEKEEVFRSKKKKDKKLRKSKQTKQEDLDEEDEDLVAELKMIDRPKLKDLLPCLIVQLLAKLIFWIPTGTKLFLERFKSSAEEEVEDEDDSLPERIRTKKSRPANTVNYPIYPEMLSSDTKPSELESSLSAEQTMDKVQISKGDWTDLEIDMLVKAVVKFPGGTVERWEKIASMVGRSTKEVISMSKQLKTNPTSVTDSSKQICDLDSIKSRNSCDTLTAVDNIPDVVFRKRNKTVAKTPDRTLLIATATKLDDKVCQSDNDMASQQLRQNWTQQQQKLLENALVQYPKDVPDRWEKIPQLIPGKTKEDCLQRCKYLADLVKKKRQNHTPTTEQTS